MERGRHFLCFSFIFLPASMLVTCQKTISFYFLTAGRSSNEKQSSQILFKSFSCWAWLLFLLPGHPPTHTIFDLTCIIIQLLLCLRQQTLRKHERTQKHPFFYYQGHVFPLTLLFTTSTTQPCVLLCLAPDYTSRRQKNSSINKGVVNILYLFVLVLLFFSVFLCTE